MSDECSKCLTTNVSKVLAENFKLKQKIENMKCWLRNMPEEWLEEDDLTTTKGNGFHAILEAAGPLIKQEEADQGPPELTLEHTGLTQQTTCISKEHDTPPVLLKSPLLMEHTGDFPKLEPQSEWLMEHPMDGETFPVFVKEEESEDLYANNTHSEFDLLGNDTDYEENQSWPGIISEMEESENSSAKTLKLACDQCDYVFKRLSHLKRHKESMHSGIRYQCTLCEYSVSKSSGLKLHIESVHKGIRYPCDKCDHAATSVKKLKEHKDSEHEGIRFPCDKCEFVATKSINLKYHKDSKHEGIRHPCDQCELTFTKSNHLKEHKRNKHEGIRYLCDQCDFSSAKPGNLKMHKENIHDMIRYPCNQCDFLSTTGRGLKQHMLNKHK